MSAILLGQNPPQPLVSSPPKAAAQGQSQGPVEVVSDTKGSDLRPFLSQVLLAVRNEWYRHIPDVAQEPVRKEGKLAIEFSVMRDGSVTRERYFQRSGSDELDRGAFEGIAGAKLPPLPADFRCNYVVLRFHFYYNPAADGPKDSTTQPSSFLPCVTTTIQFATQLGLEISPASARVVAGTRRQFAATVTGESNSTEDWRIDEPGCKAQACGEIADDGMYTAPAAVPNPVTIKITATVAGESGRTASAAITVVPPN